MTKMRFSTFAILAALLLMPVCPCQLSSSSAQVPSKLNPDYSVKDLPGFISWKTLSRKKLSFDGKKANTFPHDVEDLRNKKVKFFGFMMPLDQAEGQKHFLLSALPPSCPFCYPAGPDQLIEIFSKSPVKYSYEPVKVEGTLTLLKDDPMGMMYRIADAHQITN